MYKLLERHVRNHLYVYLAEFKLLLDEQSGFRENRSWETVLLKLTDYFLSSNAQSDLCAMIVLKLDLPMRKVKQCVVRLSTTGVPQGSILGTLFCYYVNE